MKSITKRIISTLAICGALVLEAGATAIGSLGKALNNIAKVNAANETTIDVISTLALTKSTTLSSTALKVGNTPISIIGDKAGATTAPTFNYNATNGVDLRLYKYSGTKSSVTFTASDTTITKIEFLKNETTASSLSNFSADSGTLNSNVWTGDASSVKFTYSSTSTNLKEQIYLIKLTYVGGSTPSTTYSVNYLKNTTDDVTGMPNAETNLSPGSHTLSTTKPTRSGYDFVGWNTNSAATTGITSVTISSADIDVYAIWKASSSSDKGTSESSSTIFASGDWIGTGGEAKSSNSYYLLKSSAYITSKKFTDINLSEKVDFKVTIRTFGGATYKTLCVQAFSDSACSNSICSAVTVDATSTTLTQFSVSIDSFTSTSVSEVYFKVWSSTTTSANGVGISKIKMEYSKGTAKLLTGITVKTAPSTTNYYEGDKFDPTGLVITATYDDESKADITYSGHENDFAFSPDLNTGLQTSNTSVTITYKEKSTTQSIKVNTDTLNSIELGGSVSGKRNNDWDLSKVTMIGHYASGDKEITGFTASTTTDIPTEVGSYTVKVNASFGGKNISKDYTVEVKHSGESIDDAYTVTEALEIIDGFKGTSTKNNGHDVFVKGTVSGDISISSSSGSQGAATFTMTDGSKSIKAYSVWNQDAASKVKFTTGDISVGDFAVVHGYLIDYVDKSSVHTAEVGYATGASAYAIISRNSHTVTTSLSNVTFSVTSGTKVNFDGAFNETLTPSTGYDLPSTITMTLGGSSFTSFTYNSTTGAVSIAANTIKTSDGDLVISATGVLKTLTIGKNLNNGMTLSNTADSISYGSKYEAVIENIPQYYNDPTVTITMGGVTLSNVYDSATKKIEIDSVTGNLSITASTSPIVLTSLTLDETKTVGAGGVIEFNAIVDPSNANPGVTYAIDSLNSNVPTNEYTFSGNTLTIEDEIVSGGTIVVIATSDGLDKDGKQLTAKCTVTVEVAKIAQIVSVTVGGEVKATEQYVGKTFNYAGLTFTPEWSEGEHDEVTITGADIQWPALTNGMTSITGKYSTGSSTLDVVVSGFAVVDDFLKYVFISGDMKNKTYYSNAESWDFAGLTVTGKNASGDDATIVQANVEYTANLTPAEYLSTSAEKLVVTATYGEKTDTIDITGIVVNKYKLNKIEITSNPSKVEYIIGETFSESGLVVKATYSDGTTDTDFKGYTLDKSAIDMYVAGNYSVKVQASGVTDATFIVKYGVVTPQKGETYYSRASEINVGDVVTFYAPYVEKVLTGISTTSTKYGESGDAALTDGKLVFAQDVSALDLTVCAGYQTGTYSFKIGDNYLRWNSGNSLDMAGTSVEQSTSWTVGIDSSTGHASIVNCKQESGSDRVILWNYANPRFACYKGQTPKDDTAGYGFVDIYLKTEKPEIVAELIELDVSCAKTFKEGETLYISDLTVNGLYNDGTTSTIETGVTFADSSTSKTLVAGSNTFTIKCGSVEASITIVAGEIKHVTSVTLGNTVDSLIVGQSNTFTATVAPEDATYKDIIWSVEGSGATIDQNGKLTATSTGSVTVKATAKADGVATSHTVSIIADSVTSIALNEGSTVKTTYFDGDNFDPTGLKIDVTYASGKEETITYSADCGIAFEKTTLKSTDNKVVVLYGGKSCDLPVTVSAIELISIEASTTKTSPEYGQSFTKDDVTVTAHYNDSRKDHQLASSDFTMSNNYDSHKSGETQVLSISYTENGVTKESSVSVTVKDAVVTAVDVKQNPTTTNYIVGQNFDPTGLVITLTYNDDSTVDVAYGDDTKSLFDFDVTTFTSTSQNKVVVTYAEKTADISVSVLAKAVSSISVVTSPKTDYVEGQAFDPTGLVINAIYNDGSNENIEYAGHESQISFSPTSLLYGDDKVTVTYGGQNAYITVKVIEKAITGISVVTSPKTEYIEGQTFDPTGLVINVAYNDGTNENIEYAGHESQFSFSPSTALSLDNDKVTVKFGGKSADINISVDDKSISGISVSTEPKTNYIEGQTFDPTGLEITVTYDNGSSETVKYNEHASAFSFSIDRELEQTDTSITITYSGQTADLDITVVAKTVTDIAIDESSTVKTSYDDGDNFDPTGLVIKVTYDNGKTEKITYSEGCGITFDKTKLVYGDESVVVTYQTKTANLPITVAEKYVTSITANKTELELDYNKDISSSDIEVTIHYSNGDTALADFDSLEISGYNKNVPGTYENVEVKLNDVTVQIKVTVKQSTVIDHIEVDPNTKTLEYGEEIGSYKVYAVYSDDAHVEGGHREDITSSVTVSEFDGTPGNHTLTISYNGMECSISYTVKPSEVIDHIIVSTDKTSLEFNEEFTTDDVTVKLVYTDGHEAPGQADEIIGYNPNHSGEQIITVVSGDKEATITVTVKELSEEAVVETVVETIEVAYDTQVDPNDIKVKITFEDGHTEEVGAENLQGFDPTVVGEQEVVVEVGGRSVTLKINVLPSTIVDHIEVSTSKPVVNLGSNFTSSDVSVTCVYTDGHTAPGTVEKIEGFNKDQLGSQELTVTANGHEGKVVIEVTNHFVTSITVESYNEYVDQGKDYVFANENTVVTANYADGTSTKVTDYTVSAVDTSGHGPQKATVSYDGVSAEVTVNVIQTETPVEPYQTTAIIGGAVVGVAIICAGIFFFLKKFKL